MTIKFDPKVPIYLQIMNLIKRDIVTGKLKIGDKLPSVRELASELQVNPNTLQRTYQELERQGITYTQRGMGTFIKEEDTMISELKKDMSKEILNNFIEGMLNLGFTGEEIIKVIQDKLKGGI
ncbi:GntR family transcriptional regulator [Clostridium sp. DJ247]|uniref:GntR family transcriptional regulator n=1 Tax=Clostridium sp. DJ247 TaxID=2726188 RepID=UPI0016249528|nr:GntR family transcriptional regulator [Clostridium sp. DJ247]MBC2580816.1 GntR family transcriptional regulator [Clostridium sp. DJ247]